MGKHEDFSSEEMEFLIGKFLKGLSNKDIYDEIQETTTFPPRTIRSIQKIRKIYDALNVAYERKLEKSNQPDNEKPTSVTTRDSRLKEHLIRVAEAAEKLADNIDKLRYYKAQFKPLDELPYSGNIVEGLCFNRGSYEGTEIVKVENHIAQLVLRHYQDRWETFKYSDRWENVTLENDGMELKELFENLMKLASLNTSEPCDECPKCQEISGIMTGEMGDRIFNTEAFETSENMEDK